MLKGMRMSACIEPSLYLACNEELGISNILSPLGESIVLPLGESTVGNKYQQMRCR